MSTATHFQSHMHDAAAIKRAGDKMTAQMRERMYAPDAFALLRRIQTAQNTGDADLMESLNGEAAELLAAVGGGA